MRLDSGMRAVRGLKHNLLPREAFKKRSKMKLAFIVSVALSCIIV